MSLRQSQWALVRTGQEAWGWLENMPGLADAGSVYDDPLSTEGLTVFMANERLDGIGFVTASEATGESAETDDSAFEGVVWTRTRPVAAIGLSDRGVHVEPVIDRKAVLTTFLVALGAGLLALGRRR